MDQEEEEATMSCMTKVARATIPVFSAAVLLVSSLAAEVVVSIAPVSCAPGGTAVAWITFENAAGTAGADLTLRLPEFVVPRSAVTTDQATGFLVASHARAGQIDVAIASPAGLTVDQAVILAVPFAVDRTAEPGVYPLTFEQLQVFDSTPATAMSLGPPGTLVVTPPPADVDADGLPDDWETAFFGSIDGSGTADSDFDGVVDWKEFIAGTDPTRSESVFAVDQVEVGHPAGVVVLRWAAQEDRLYQIEWSDDPLGPGMTWHPVYNPSIRADDAGAEWVDDGSQTDPLPLATRQRFYRVQTELP